MIKQLLMAFNILKRTGGEQIVFYSAWRTPGAFFPLSTPSLIFTNFLLKISFAYT